MSLPIYNENILRLACGQVLGIEICHPNLFPDLDKMLLLTIEEAEKEDKSKGRYLDIVIQAGHDRFGDRGEFNFTKVMNPCI